MAKTVGCFIDARDHVFASLGGSREIVDVITPNTKVKNFFEALTHASTEELTSYKNVVRDMLKTAKMDDSEASIVLPDSMCSLQILTLPILREKEIISAIELQADEFIPYPIDKASYDYQVLSVDNKKNVMSILLLVALKDLISSLEEFILEIGLYPGSLESVSTSMYKVLFHHDYTPPGSIILLVTVDDGGTQVSVVNTKLQVVLMTYSFNMGTNFFLRGIQNYRNLSYEDALLLLVEYESADPEVKTLLNSLFQEYSKEIKKVIASIENKLAIRPEWVMVHGTIAQVLRNQFETAAHDISLHSQVLNIEALIDKKFLRATNTQMLKVRANVLPAVATCLD